MMNKSNCAAVHAGQQEGKETGERHVGGDITCQELCSNGLWRVQIDASFPAGNVSDFDRQQQEAQTEKKNRKCEPVFQTDRKTQTVLTMGQSVVVEY